MHHKNRSDVIIEYFLFWSNIAYLIHCFLCYDFFSHISWKRYYSFPLPDTSITGNLYSGVWYEIVALGIKAWSEPRDVCFMITNPQKQHSVNTVKWRQNGRHFAKGIFKCPFLMQILFIESNFTEVFSEVSNQWASGGSSNGLVPNKQPAIIWTNEGLAYCTYRWLNARKTYLQCICSDDNFCHPIFYDIA